LRLTGFHLIASRSNKKAKPRVKHGATEVGRLVICSICQAIVNLAPIWSAKLPNLYSPT
jgi:hypothetical protein